MTAIALDSNALKHRFILFSHISVFASYAAKCQTGQDCRHRALSARDDICLYRSASPALCMRGLNRAVGSSTTLGSPMDSGISTASFETARVDALTRSSSGQDSQLQTVIQGTAVASNMTQHHV